MKPSLVVLTTDEFDRDVKRLRRKYRRIAEDIRGLLQDFERLGIHGDRIRGLSRLVRKVRLTNRSANRGKSGGFRALYVVDAENVIRLFRIYSKTEEDTLSLFEISRSLDALP